MDIKHPCTDCGEVFADIIAYEYHECSEATMCGFCMGLLATGTHSETECTEPALVESAREWLTDAFPWDEFENMDEREIWDGVDRHYEGGIIQFARDGTPYIPVHNPPDCGPCTGYASRLQSLRSTQVTRAYGPIPSASAE